MVSRITLLILGFCVFLEPGSSYLVKQNKADVKERIIDGIPTSIEYAAHHVQLIVNYNDTNGNFKQGFFCGGSLITNEIVLTAAHCLRILEDKKIRDLDVYAGSGKLYDYIEKRSWKSISLHPYFHKNDKRNKDIALIKVDKPFSSSKIVPIPLTMTPPKAFEQLTVNGFGLYIKRNATYSPILRQVTGTLVDCSRPDLGFRTDICVKNPVGKGTCFGDSGSGLLNSNDELTGIVSSMFGECGTNEKDVYISVYDHLMFIVAGLHRLSPNDELAKKMINKVYEVFAVQSGSFE